MNNVAGALIESGAFQTNFDEPYTRASGLKSPFYCDNRILLSDPLKRDLIISEFISKIQNNFPDCEAIAGVATAGIPRGAIIADKMGLPFVYVRSKPKEHGKQQKIEGKLEQQQKIIVIEDLISTGKSSNEAATELENNGVNVLGILSIMNYGLPVIQEYSSSKIFKILSLCDFDELIVELKAKKLATEDQIKELQHTKNLLK